MTRSGDANAAPCACRAAAVKTPRARPVRVDPRPAVRRLDRRRGVRCPCVGATIFCAAICAVRCAAGCLRSVLHRLPQPEAQNGRTRPRHAGREPSGSERRRVGAGHREIARRLDAAAGQATARSSHVSHRGRLARARDRPRLDRASEPGAGPRRSPSQSHRIQQCGARSARPRSPHRGCPIAAARRRHRRRQLRQLRRRPHHFNRASRALPVGRAPADAACDRPSAIASGDRDIRDSAARHAGRSPERRPAARLARRHRRALRLSDRRGVPDQSPFAAAVSGLHHGHGLAAAARCAARWAPAQTVYCRRRGEGQAGGVQLRRQRRTRFCRRSRMGRVHAGGRRRASRDSHARRARAARRRRRLRARAVGTRRAAAAASARQGADRRRAVHGLRERRLGPDRRAVREQFCNCAISSPPSPRRGFRLR